MINKGVETRRRNKAEESANLAAIMEFLQWSRVFAFRVNNTPVFDTTRNVFRSMGKFTRKGVADILGIVNGIPLAIEVKREGGKLSKDQEDFLEEFEQNGGIAIVATSPDEVQRRLKSHLNK